MHELRERHIAKLSQVLDTKLLYNLSTVVQFNPGLRESMTYYENRHSNQIAYRKNLSLALLSHMVTAKIRLDVFHLKENGYIEKTSTTQ